jgi:hypothetical protein
MNTTVLESQSKTDQFQGLNNDFVPWRGEIYVISLEKPNVRLYAQLVGLVDTLVDQVEQVQPWLARQKSPEAEGLRLEFETYLPLVRQVVTQTRQRVLQGTKVPAADKIVSLFEPHTYIICRGKSKPKDTEFGHKVWFAEVDGGLITEYLGRQPARRVPRHPQCPATSQAIRQSAAPTLR